MITEQVAGLSKNAEKFLQENAHTLEVITEITTLNKRTGKTTTEQSIKTVYESGKSPFYYDTSTLDNGELKSYFLKNGRVVYEKVQTERWRSGLITFLALAEIDGNFIIETLWDTEEMKELI